MNGDELVSLLIEYELGIKRSEHEILELGDVEVDE